MSEIVRLTLVSHAMTDAMAAGRFPTDEPLNTLGQRQADTVLDFGRVDEAVCGPEQRTVQTADRLGLHAATESGVADLGCGQWRGKDLGAVPPADLAIWLTDPGARPPGGESIVELSRRVRDWLGTVAARRGRVVAVTHPAVIRAVILTALEAPPRSFWRIDIAPVSVTVLHFRGQSWTLRST